MCLRSLLALNPQNFNQAKDRKSQKSVTIITPAGSGRSWGHKPSSLFIKPSIKNRTEDKSLWSTMLKLFAITNTMNGLGLRLGLGPGRIKVGRLIDRQGDSRRHHRRLWLEPILVFRLFRSLPLVGCCQLTFDNDFRFGCVPLAAQPSIDCQLVDCLPNCHRLFPFPIKALENSFESTALAMPKRTNFERNDFCNSPR